MKFGISKTVKAKDAEYRNFNGKNVTATPLDYQGGFEDVFAPPKVSGTCLVTESKPIFGGPIIAYIYTVDGWSVKPSTIKEI